MRTDNRPQNRLSIALFKTKGLDSALFYRNDILITDHVEYLEPFRTPCRLDATTVFICTAGTLECSINLKRYSLKKQTVVVLLSDDIIQIHKVENLEAYAVIISNECLGDLQIDFRQRASFRLDIRRKAMAEIPFDEIMQLKPYYRLLAENMVSSKTERREILRGLIRAFSYTIISLIHACQQPEESSAAMPRAQQLFNRFMALLDIHHMKERSVGFYAENLCLTPNYLSSEIKHFSGKSALEWINEYVITEAKIMLRHTDGSIQSIADDLHFPSQSAFGKYFKQQTGMGPRAYRNEG